MLTRKVHVQESTGGCRAERRVAALHVPIHFVGARVFQVGQGPQHLHPLEHQSETHAETLLHIDGPAHHFFAAAERWLPYAVKDGSMLGESNYGSLQRIVGSSSEE